VRVEALAAQRCSVRVSLCTRATSIEPSPISRAVGTADCSR
jgi:hypothetical protein